MSLCPFCRQELPDPPERFCPNCGRELAPAGELPPSPAAGAPPGGPPWERRDASWLAALVETTQQVLTSPGAFFRSMPVTGGVGAPLGYALIVGTIGLVATTLYRAIFWMVFGSSFATFGRRSELEWMVPFLQGGAGLIVQLIFGPPFLLVALFVASGILHLLLMLIGGARRGFEATFRAVCYSEAAAFLQIIPFCGSFLSAACMLVLAVIGLSAAHGIGKGTAAAAILLPLILLCCCCGGLIAVVFSGFGSAFRQML